MLRCTGSSGLVGFRGAHLTAREAKERERTTFGWAILTLINIGQALAYRSKPSGSVTPVFRDQVGFLCSAPTIPIIRAFTIPIIRNTTPSMTPSESAQMRSCPCSRLTTSIQLNNPPRRLAARRESADEVGRSAGGVHATNNTRFMSFMLTALRPSSAWIYISRGIIFWRPVSMGPVLAGTQQRETLDWCNFID